MRYVDGDLNVHSYKSYDYRPWDDRDEDNRKRFHDVYDEHNMYIASMPLSPYSHCDFETFSKWIDLGLPKRTIGMYGEANIHSAHKEWLDKQIDAILVGDKNDEVQ